MKQRKNFIQKIKKILVILLICTLSLQSLGGFFVPQTTYSETNSSKNDLKTNYSPPSLSNSKNSTLIQQSAPDPPVISYPTDGSSAGATTDSWGTAEVGSTVSVTLNNNPTPVYSGISDSGGWWYIEGIVLSPTGIDGNGKNRMEYIATNAYGSSGPIIIYVYYNSPPTVNITFPTGGEKLKGNQNVTTAFTDSEEDNLFYALYYSANGGSSWEFLEMDSIYYDPGIPGYPDKIFNWDTTTVNDGNNYAMLASVDDGSNYVLSSPTGIFTIDNTGPYPTINPPSSTPIANNYTFTGNANDNYSNISSVQWRVNSGSWNTATITSGAGTPNVTYSFQINLADGNYTFEVRATDTLGNTTDAGNYATMNVDVGTGSGVPASPSITNPKNNSTTNQGTITVSGLAEPYSTVKIYLNSPSSGTPVAQTQASASASYTFNNIVLTPGANTLITTATNGYGTSADSTTINITYDNLSVYLSYPPVSIWTGTKTISWSSSGIYSASSTYDLEYSSDNGLTWKRLLTDTTSTFYNWDTTSVRDGASYKIRVIADDGILTVSYTSGTFTIDNNLPQVTLYPLSPDPANTQRPTFYGFATGQNKIAALEYSIDGGGWYQASPSDGSFNSVFERFAFTTPTLSLSTHTVRVRAKDSLGGYTVSSNYASDTFTLYNNNPSVSILTPKGGEIWNKGSYLISWAASDPDNNPLTFTVQYLIGGTTVTLASGLTQTSYIWNLQNIKDSNYQIKITAYDGIGSTSALSGNFIIDTTSPTITIDPIPSPTRDKSPTFSGSAFDNLSGILYVEYQINSENWYKAIIVSGYKTNEVTFRFKYPFELSEGINYIQARATDQAGNIGYSETITLIVDTTPPCIGANMIKQGNQVLLPDQNGKIEVPPGSTVELTVAITGEPETAFIEIKNDKIPLDYSKATGLYTKDIDLDDEGKWPLKITTSDKLKNTRSREIAILKVSPYGKIYNKKDNSPVSGAEVSIYLLDKETNAWNLWDGEAYKQSNPIKSNEKGNYSFILPSGQYYLEAKAEGFYNYKSKKFQVEKNKLINFNIGLSPVIKITIPTHLLGLPKIILTLRQLIGGSSLLLVLILSIIILIKRHNYNHYLNQRRGGNEKLGIH